MSLKHATWRRRSCEYYPRCATIGHRPVFLYWYVGTASQYCAPTRAGIEVAAEEMIGTLGVSDIATGLKASARRFWIGSMSLY